MVFGILKRDYKNNMAADAELIFARNSDHVFTMQFIERIWFNKLYLPSTLASYSIRTFIILLGVVRVRFLSYNREVQGSSFGYRNTFQT